MTITLPPDLETFLDSLRERIRDLGGSSLGRTEIIRAALEYIKLMEIDCKGIQDEKDLLEQLIKAIKPKK